MTTFSVCGYEKELSRKVFHYWFGLSQWLSDPDCKVSEEG